jgi:hypothetical protein
MLQSSLPDSENAESRQVCFRYLTDVHQVEATFRCLATLQVRISNRVPRNGRGSIPFARAANANVQASRHNTRRCSNIRDLDNKVDLRRQLSLTPHRNTAQDHSRDHSLDNRRSSLRSLQGRAWRKVEQRARSISFSLYGYSDQIDELRARVHLIGRINTDAGAHLPSSVTEIRCSPERV